ncbi:hypothetical protein BX600DRAFT_473745 [Xylariales sp. PMI_506]|nr:hypothetical protein BX600DRAFT_473745 [Xylariales sp. PMI_506]
MLIVLRRTESDHLPAPGNRSEQIAQAQRKHRQRTQSYIQALEEEVLRLRGVEGSLKKEVEQLREQSQPKHDNSTAEQSTAPTPAVAGFGSSSGISPPPPPETEDTIVVDWDELAQTTAEPPCCITAAEVMPPESLRAANTDGAHPIHSSSCWADAFADILSKPNACAPDEEVKDEADDATLSDQVGLNYILQLERPCLPHLKHVTTMVEPRKEGYLVAPYNWGTNHAYNLSTRLFHEYRLESPQETLITSNDLDNLLQASERLQLANELTPVQVWALVCKLNSIHRIDMAVVNAMFEELSKYSYCNSFGTAISKDTIQAAFQQFLGWSPAV